VETPGDSESGGSHPDASNAYGTTPFGAPVARTSEVAFLTPAEVAAQLRVSRATVYALIERGELAAQRVGLALRIGVGDLEEYTGVPIRIRKTKPLREGS
jgi:excisionase family DNA binding protein